MAITSIPGGATSRDLRPGRGGTLSQFSAPPTDSVQLRSNSRERNPGPRATPRSEPETEGDEKSGAGPGGLTRGLLVAALLAVPMSAAVFSASLPSRGPVPGPAPSSPAKVLETPDAATAGPPLPELVHAPMVLTVPVEAPPAVEPLPAGPITSNPSPARLERLLEDVAREERVDPDILKAVAWQESNWQHFERDGKVTVGANREGGKVTSRDWGLMQINDLHHPRAFPAARKDVRANVTYAARFLRGLYDETGTWREALTRYNGASYYGPLILELAESRPWQVAYVAEASPSSVGTVQHAETQMRRAAYRVASLQPKVERARRQLARLESNPSGKKAELKRSRDFVQSLEARLESQQSRLEQTRQDFLQEVQEARGGRWLVANPS